MALIFINMNIFRKSKKYDRQFSSRNSLIVATPNKVWHKTCKYCSYNNNNIQFICTKIKQHLTILKQLIIKTCIISSNPDICMITHEVDYGKGSSFATDCERVISIQHLYCLYGV